MIFLALLFIPVLVDMGMLIFARKRFHLGEFGIAVGIQAVVAGIALAAIYCSNVHDTELINGVVTNKETHHVLCEHSYQCHCYQSCSGSGSKQSCSQHCSTCYEHYFDVSWFVHTNVNNTFTISRVDRQGLMEPPRYSSVQPGDPVAFTHGFDNYIKGSPDTLFRAQGLVEKYKEKLPHYPTDIYDYYRIDRVVLVNGAALPDLKVWNERLSQLNGKLGPGKQSNVVLVITKALPNDYFYALAQHWLGGKKNDVVVVMDTTDGQKIDWVSVMSWTDNQILKVSLRDQLLDVGQLDAARIFPVIEDNVSKFFVRKHMKDFAYLRGQITPSAAQFTWAAIISFLVSIGTSIFFYKNPIS